MIRDIRRFTQAEYDLLIVGGGINGAAMANLAARQGLKVALLEKGDFASGTSSKSTKLVHGGIRYLENFEFGLVREALKERYIQLHSAPHLVKPLKFIIPIYRGDKRPLWMMRLGVFLYDLLSGHYALEKHRSLKFHDVLREVPDLNKEDLLGAVSYSDAQMDDARLVLENVLSADAKGAHVANYVELLEFVKVNGRVAGAKAKDLLSGETFSLRARRAVCCGGPWTNELLTKESGRPVEKVRTTKGVHIVYPGQLSKHALLIPSRRDERIFFIIPWMGNSLIGTTDTDYHGKPDEVKTEEADIQYLFQEARRVFPGTAFSEDKIITTFAGLRPLVRKQGSPSKVSRKHVIEKTVSGLVVVMGGKYTTYRTIALDCLETLLNRPVQSDQQYPLYGSGPIPDIKAAVQRFGVGENVAQMLADKYGSRYSDVLQLVERDPGLKERLCSCSDAIKAQVVYAIKTEMAGSAEDIIWRRLGLGYLECPNKQHIREIELLREKYR